MMMYKNLIKPNIYMTKVIVIKVIALGKGKKLKNYYKYLNLPTTIKEINLN